LLRRAARYISGAADPDQPGLAAPGHADPGHGAVQVGEQAAPALQQFRAGPGELDAAPGPGEQARRKEAFEPRDRLGQAGLGDVQVDGTAPSSADRSARLRHDN
jgi:hypothetical protein